MVGQRQRQTNEQAERSRTVPQGPRRRPVRGGRWGPILVLLFGATGLVGLGARPAIAATPAVHPSVVATLSLANFVIVDPLGNATSHSGPADVALGSGQHLLSFDTLGYRFTFIDTARVLEIGQYSTSVDAWVGMTNDPSCEAGTTHGGFRIDQVAYDSSGQPTALGVQFEFDCDSGTQVHGTIAYDLTDTTSNQGYYLYQRSGVPGGFGNDNYLLYLGDPALLGTNAPIVGMVPTASGDGYRMAASDGGVFAFGDARFEGSCPGIGGCRGAAVSVVPDATGNGYWVVTNSGAVYTFGDAVNDGQPGTQSSSITSAAATPDGDGSWILDAAGQVFPFGNAASPGGMPPGSAGGFNPASAVFATSDGAGYLVVTAAGKVSCFGDAPADGDMSATHLNGPIVAASGS